MIDQRKAEEWSAFFLAIQEARAKFALRQTARQIIPPNMAEIMSQYPRIKVPTLIVWGREDSIIPLRNGIRLHDDLKNSQLVIIDRCGHDPPEERPEKVIEIMQKFLGDGFQSRLD